VSGTIETLLSNGKTDPVNMMAPLDALLPNQ
jgi:hypothetical protein